MWRINYNSPKSYHNFVDPDKFDLTCTDRSILGLLGSAYFGGFAISSTILPRLSDKHGRKIPYVCSLIIQ